MVRNRFWEVHFKKNGPNSRRARLRPGALKERTSPSEKSPGRGLQRGHSPLVGAWGTPPEIYSSPSTQGVMVSQEGGKGVYAPKTTRSGTTLTMTRF